MIKNKNLQTVLDLAEACSSSLKNIVEKTLNKTPQDLLNVSNTTTYFSKTKNGADCFNYVYNSHSKINYNNSFNGTCINYSDRNSSYNIYFCDSKYFKEMQYNSLLNLLPVLELNRTKNDTTTSYGLVLKRCKNGYQLSIFTLTNGVYNSEIICSYLTEQEFANIVNNELVKS